MDCQAIKREELAEKYVHHRLDAAQMDEFETHLLECPKCARELELLQAVQTDLAERAHEIRARTATAARPAVLLRWQVAGLAFVLLIAVSAGVLQLRKMKHGPEMATAPPQKQDGVAPAGPVEQVSGSVPAGVQASHPSQSQPPADQKPKLIAAGSKRSQETVAAVSPGSQTGESSKPSAALAPPDIPVPPKAGNDQTSASNAKLESAYSDAALALTTEQGVELYRLSEVVPPSYTFSGLVRKGKLPGTGRKDTYASGNPPSDAGRQLFQNAMDAYIQGGYSEATGNLQAALKYEPDAADINFYLGACKLLEGHPEEATAPLRHAVAAGNSPFLQAAHYYLAKAYLQGEKLADAESELQHAANVPGRLTTDAKTLLARLQALRAQIEKQ